MAKLLEDYDNTVIDDETNNICNCIDTVKILKYVNML